MWLMSIKIWEEIPTINIKTLSYYHFKKQYKRILLNVKVTTHNRPQLLWHLAHILSASLHNTAVASSKAKLLWPLYTSIKAINFFLFFLLFILFLRYAIQCKYTGVSSSRGWGRGGGGFFPIEVMWVLVVLFRGLKFVDWYRLGC